MAFSQEELEHIWNQTLNEVKEKLSNPSFKTWFSNTKPVDLKDDNILMIEVPNDFIKDWIETRYNELITDIIQNLTDTNLKCRFYTEEELNELNEVEEDNKQKKVEDTNKEEKKENTRNKNEEEYNI